MHPQPKAVSGHVFKVSRKRGDCWYCKYRLPDGRQVQRKIGPHWSERKTDPAPGYFTKASAQRWLDNVLAEARRGELPGMVQTGSTFAAALDEWLVYKVAREPKRSTANDYRHTVAKIKALFGETNGASVKLEHVTVEMVERYRDALMEEGRSDRTVNKHLTILYGVFKWAQRAHRLTFNPVALVEKRPTKKAGEIDVYENEEVLALVRAAETDADSTLFLLAARTGMRMGELLALRWGDVDFPKASIRVRRNFTFGAEDTPKSGKGRTVPLVPEAAKALARLNGREDFTDDGDLVFPAATGRHQLHRKVRERYVAAQEKAELRQLRFHDLRHTFGSFAIRQADVREVQEWMGHGDIRTTMRYLQFKPQADAAERLALAFAPEPVSA